MPSGISSFRLEDVRLPFTAGGARYKAKPSSSDDDEYEPVSTRPGAGSSRRHRHACTVDLLRVAKWTVAALICFVVVFAWRYEVHVEVQLFSRGWIRTRIEPVAPASSQCFSPSHIQSRTSYNQTLADAPKYVDVHAGLAMPLGRDCYDFADTVPRLPVAGMHLAPETIFHVYWRDDLLPVGERQVQLLESILATQDRDSTRVIFWTNARSADSVRQLDALEPVFARYGTKRLEVRKVDKRQLATGTPMDRHAWLDLADSQAWVDGDLVRVLVLYQFGGLWVDFDTILTGRDLRVLGEHEWVTQWDCYDKKYQPLNGAMMHFFRHSPYLCEMLHVMSTNKAPQKNSVDWGARLYHQTWRSLVRQGVKPFKVLPFCFTDGVSCRLDNRLPDPFERGGKEDKWGEGRWQELRTKVDNVWAVHLHNRWDKSFPAGGWVDEMILKPVKDRASKYSLPLED